MKVLGRLVGSMAVAASTNGASRLISIGLWNRRPGESTTLFTMLASWPAKAESELRPARRTLSRS